MKNFISIILVIVAFTSVLKADEIFYDITFSSPEHTVGQVPVTGSSPTRPSQITFGAPIVSSFLGLLQDQPLVFNTTGNTQPCCYYDQIRLNVSKNADFYYVAFDVLTQNLIGSTNAFTIFFDTPTVRNIHFRNDGSIFIFVPWKPGRTSGGTIGSFTDNTLMHCEVYLDMAQKEWTIFVNNDQIHSGLFDPDDDIRSIRFSLGSNNPDHTTNVGLDNIIVADYVTAIPVLKANIDITPETLNSKSQGKWITCKVNLDDCDVNDIDTESILLAGIVTPDRVKVTEDGLQVKFNRLIVIDTLILQEGLDRNGGFAVFVDVAVTGQLNDGTEFEGTDRIRFIHNAIPTTIHHRRQK